MEFNPHDIVKILPLLIVTGTALAVLIMEITIRRAEPYVFIFSIAGLAAAAVSAAGSFGVRETAFFDMVSVGGYAAFFHILLIILTVLTFLISRQYIQRMNIYHSEYYALILFSLVGMMLIASSRDLLMLFIGIELMSVSFYVLAGFMRSRLTSNESALKYFLLGAFSTGFLIYGIALIYGATGTTGFDELSARFDTAIGNHLFWAGAGLLVMGFSFKVASVPFHMWAPDVYEGAPTTITAFLSTAGKAAAFSGFLVVVTVAFAGGAEKLQDLFAILAAASMIAGNVLALSQQNLKRMLAYSSIAHAGYLLIGFAAGNEAGVSGILFYIVAYGFMNIGAFGILSMIEYGDSKNLSFDDYRGFASRKPLLGALMAVFMFSLSGIPPFAGFFGKYYIFLSAIQAGYTWLAVVGVLASVVGVYYYIRVVIYMYFYDGDVVIEEEPSRIGIIALVVSALAVIYMGILPSAVLRLTVGLF
jgi:NADH-quinone oxidoreductase subunit N